MKKPAQWRAVRVVIALTVIGYMANLRSGNEKARSVAGLQGVVEVTVLSFVACHRSGNEKARRDHSERAS
jgi:hypothetical protein